LRVHARELGKATAAQRDVSGSSAGGISDPHEGRGIPLRKAQRNVEADVEANALGGGAFSQDSTTWAGDTADSAETALARANLPSKDAQAGRKGGFIALAFDGIDLYVYVCIDARIFVGVYISNQRRTKVIMYACVYVLL